MAPTGAPVRGHRDKEPHSLCGEQEAGVWEAVGLGMSAQLALLSAVYRVAAPLYLNGHLTEVQLLFDVNTDLHARGGGKSQPLPVQNPLQIQAGSGAIQ